MHDGENLHAIPIFAPFQSESLHFIIISDFLHGVKRGEHFGDCFLYAAFQLQAGLEYLFQYSLLVGALFFGLRRLGKGCDKMVVQATISVREGCDGIGRHGEACIGQDHP